MEIFSKIPINIVADGIITVVATILTGLISLYIAILTLKRQSTKEELKQGEVEIINKESVIEFLDFSMASLLYISMYEDEELDEATIKRLIVEVKKISSVNLELNQIKPKDLPKEFRKDYQRCKILLKILEIEITASLENMNTGKLVNTKGIDIKKRMNSIHEKIKLYK